MFRRLAVAGASLAIAFTGMLAPNSAQAACTVNVGGTCTGTCFVNYGTCESGGTCTVNAGTCGSNCTVNAGKCHNPAVSIQNICDVLDDVCR